MSPGILMKVNTEEGEGERVGQGGVGEKNGDRVRKNKPSGFVRILCFFQREFGHQFQQLQRS